MFELVCVVLLSLSLSIVSHGQVAVGNKVLQREIGQSNVIPDDLKDRTYSCSTQRIIYQDKLQKRHFAYRAFLHGVRNDGDKWERTLGFRPYEKQATKDCQLWQEMVNTELNKTKENK